MVTIISRGGRCQVSRVRTWSQGSLLSVDSLLVPVSPSVCVRVLSAGATQGREVVNEATEDKLENREPEQIAKPSALTSCHRPLCYFPFLHHS